MVTHECNTPKHITDEDVLLMFKYGRLRIRKSRSKNPEVVSFGKVLAQSLVEGRSNPRWRVQLHLHGKKRTIVRAKIVWLGVKGPIPEGMELHHRDEDRLNDSIDNLELLTDAIHSDFHYGNDDF